MRTCRYIDDYHVEIGDNLYHICELAERKEQNGHTYEPVRTDLPEQCYWIYFNPDSTAGGQYVSGELDFNVFKELIGQYDIENHPENAEQFTADLEEMSDQFLADINTPFFAEAENEYESTTEYTDFTSQNILQIHETILSYSSWQETLPSGYRKHREEKRIEKNEERVNRYEERFRREEQTRSERTSS